MKNTTEVFLTIAALLCMHPCGAQSFFTPGQLWPDDHGVHINAHGGGMLVHNDTYYWFGEHKIAGSAGNKAHVGVHCYSSKDLYHWKDEGIALQVSDDSASLLGKECIIERPKVIYNAKTRRFVMWFHHELKGMGYKAAMTGVAVSERVTGPYTYLKSVNPNKGRWPLHYPDSLKNRSVDISHTRAGSAGRLEAVTQGAYLRRDFERGQMARDMTLFVDDDGTAYHIYASEENQTLHIATLTDDFLDFSGQYVRALEGKQNEAPALFKKDGKYYMITSGLTGWAPNAARLAVANHPFGPWETLNNPCRGPDNEVSKTFHSQSTYVLQLPGKKDAFIFMADRWTPENAIDGRYIWLPVQFEKDEVVLEWKDKWDLSVFD